jgi:hypothetical protein
LNTIALPTIPSKAGFLRKITPVLFTHIQLNNTNLLGDIMSEELTVAQESTRVVERSTTPKRKRINLDISLEANAKLEEMGHNSGKSVSEILRTALTIYAIIQDEKDKGFGIGIIGKNRDTIVREILIP